MIESPSGTARAALLGFVPLILGAMLTWLVALLDGTEFHDAILLPPDPLGAARFLLALMTTLLAYVGVYVAPGLLVMRALRITLPTAIGTAIAAFVLSLLSVSLAWIVAQGVTDGIAGRTCLYLTVAVVDAAALLAAVFLAPGASAVPRVLVEKRSEILRPVIGLLLLFALGWVLMPGKISVEALEGDATEVRGFAASLFERGLPEWDLESGAWGFYPTFVFVAYPVFFSLATVGLSEAAVRLPALLFLGLLLIAAADLAGRDRARGAAGALIVLLPVLTVGYLSMQVGAYYAGYHPFHGDLACSPLEEWMVTGLALASALLLRDGAPGLAAIAGLLSILTFPSGLMFVGLLGLAALVIGPSARSSVWRWGGTLAGLVLAYAVLLSIYTKMNGSFDAMIGEWYAKYFAGRASFASESPGRMLLALGWFVLLCGGLPALGFVAALRGDRIARWLALAGGLWVAFFLFSPNKNVHYFMPAALIPVTVALRSLIEDEKRARSLMISAALTMSAVFCTLLCRPAPVPPYTADRDFGRRTVFLAASEREAVEYSKVIHNLSQPLWRWQPGDPWTIGHHTWVLYADRTYEMDRDYDFYVGQGPPPVKGLREITRTNLMGGGTATLWSPGGRTTLREWKQREFPLRNELSRFNFDMMP